VTAGGAFDACTVTVTGEDVFTPPRLSVALAVNAYDPLGTPFQVIAYGETLVVPITLLF
jgi:hypothetical protein